MNNFTNTEMANMHFIYGLANGNAEEARRIYQDRYPNIVIPCAKTFRTLHARLCETGSLNKRKGSGRPTTVDTPELEEAILDEIEENPSLSTRKIALQLEVSPTTVWKVLKRNLLYPYHIQRVQALLPQDFHTRLMFCRWLMHMMAHNNNFLRNILFTDEANFSRDAIVNFHNDHFWADENPHVIRESHFQQHFSLNVWAGFIGDYLIGPFFLPARLTGETYTDFLRHHLPILLDEVPLLVRASMWFMHDGAPAHFSVVARQHLDIAYPNRWIGRAGPQNWPARSPDMNPIDFYLWGHLKALVYKTPVIDVNDLRNRIIDNCNVIRNTPGIFERARQSMTNRLQSCILSEGGHFAHLM